jgi:cell division protein FtsN
MIRHDPSVLPKVRKSLKDAKEDGKEVRHIMLSDDYFKGFVMATKPSANEQLEDYFRGLVEAPKVYLRKIPVMHLAIPTDEQDPIVIIEGRPILDHEIDDTDEAPIC